MIKLYKRIMANMLHIPPTNYHLLAAQQEPYKKKQLITNEKYLSFLEIKKKKSQENGTLVEK